MLLPLLDELAGGLSVASAPSLAHETGTGLFGLTTALLVTPMLTSFLEAPIFAWTDRHKGARRFLVAGGLAGMAISVAVMSFVSGPLGLVLAGALYGPMSGIAMGTGEAMLVDGSADAHRRLARWSLFGSLGDVLAPLILALAAAAGFHWRSSFRVSSVALGMMALGSIWLLPREAAETAEEDDEEEEPLLQSFRAALSNRPLLAWLFAAALCTLLDELLAVFAALWVTERFSPALAAPTLIAFSVGATVGSALLERALSRRSPAFLLAVSSLLCAASLFGWLFSPTWQLALACSFVVGLAAAPLHPLAKAEAFATMPTRPGLVNGASQVFVIVDLVAPAILGAIAEHHGLRIALGLLALQPLALLGMALLAKRTEPPARSRDPVPPA